MVMLTKYLDVGHSEHALQLACWNHHGPRPRRGSWCRLRECRRHGRMKADIAFDLLHYLMNVAVQDSDRAKSLHIAQRGRPILRAPTPLLIDHHQRIDSKDNNRRQ